MASSPNNSRPDVENQPAVDEYLPGFTELSAYIGSCRDLALFNRFSTLGARNLLYLQLELLALEEQLKEYDEEDRQIVKKNSILDSDGKLVPNDLAFEILLPAKDWKGFVRRAPTKENEYWNEKLPPSSQTGTEEGSGTTARPLKLKDDRQHRKMLTILRIREVLKQYQEALILHAEVLKLESPGSRPLKVFQEWFNNKRPFIGTANNIYNKDDIVALRPDPAQDRLSKILQKRFGWAFQEKKAIPKSWGTMTFYSEKQISRVVQILSVLFSAFALTVAIICLHYANTTAQRFGAFGGFLFAFVLVIGTLTAAKTSEMLAATAAYGAVLVVFIATGLQENQTCDCNNPALAGG